MAAAGFAVSLLMASFGAEAASGDFMQTGKLTSQPIGHYEFWQGRPKECGITSRDTRALQLNHSNWQRIVEINLSVNERIKPMTDMEIYGVEEYWAYPTTVGDCEYYVLLSSVNCRKPASRSPIF
jgi:predicted transglutaminase-like cysteine proteinase